MILPAPYDALVWRNGIYRQRFQMTINSAPVDMTGDSVAMHVRAKEGDTGPPVIALDTAAPNANLSVITFIDDSIGLFEVYISNDDLDLVPEATNKPSAVLWRYNIIRTEAGGDFYPIYYGAFTVNEGVDA